MVTYRAVLRAANRFGIEARRTGLELRVGGPPTEKPAGRAMGATIVS